MKSAAGIIPQDHLRVFNLYHSSLDHLEMLEQPEHQVELQPTPLLQDNLMAFHLHHLLTRIMTITLITDFYEKYQENLLIYENCCGFCCDLPVSLY